MPSQPSSKPFAAHVLADFTAELECELTVHSGDFVLVLPDPAPQGWCRVRLGSAEGGQAEGLVPWYYIVSAAHAELEAATAHLAVAARAEEDDDNDLSTDGPGKPSAGGAVTAPPGQPAGGQYLEVMAMRGQAGLGLDLDNTNVVRRVSPGSMAAQQGLIIIGDSILQVRDGPPPRRYSIRPLPASRISSCRCRMRATFVLVASPPALFQTSFKPRFRWRVVREPLPGLPSPVFDATPLMGATRSTASFTLSIPLYLTLPLPPPPPLPIVAFSVAVEHPPPAVSDPPPLYPYARRWTAFT
jgi:hypothetical protein